MPHEDVIVIDPLDRSHSLDVKEQVLLNAVLLFCIKLQWSFKVSIIISSLTVDVKVIVLIDVFILFNFNINFVIRIDIGVLIKPGFTLDFRLYVWLYFHLLFPFLNNFRFN